MNVSLTPELEKLIADKVATGMYASASEVVREALRIMQRRDSDDDVRLDELRADIARGYAQIRRGESRTYASATEMADAIKQSARARMEAER